MSSHQKNPKLYFHKPTMHSTKKDARLIVWGESANWMVMDAEALTFLQRFDGRTTVGRVIREHAAAYKKIPEIVAKEASTLMTECLKRGVLSQMSTEQAAGAEPIEIVNVTINLTNRCNLKCSFCYNEVRGGEEASIEDMHSFLKEGKTMLSNDASLIVLGGEPFLKPEKLLEFIDFAQEEIEPVLTVSTNGTLITDKIISSLSKRRVEVQISLDSYLKERHDALRGQGVFDKAVDAAKRLVDAQVPTILSMVYAATNIDEMEHYLDLALLLQVNEARFIPLRNASAAAAYNPEARPNQLKAFHNLLSILEKRPEARKLLKRDFFSIAMIQCASSSSRVSCGIGRRVIFLDADGSVYPCPNHVSDIYKLGNIRENSLEEIVLHTERTKKLRDTYHIDRYTKCQDCAFRRWCAGDCRGEVMALTNDPFAPSPHCDELREMYTQMLWLIAEQDPRISRLYSNSNDKAAKDVFLT